MYSSVRQVKITHLSSNYHANNQVMVSDYDVAGVMCMGGWNTYAWMLQL